MAANTTAIFLNFYYQPEGERDKMDYGYIFRSVILQVLVFSIIPVCWWGLTRRKTVRFFDYVGLSKPKSNGQSSMYAVIIYCAVWVVTHLPVFTQYTQPSANVYYRKGFSAIIPMLLVSFIQQGLAEEVLFRGFIGKRICSKVGFAAGNIIQAAIFGALHVALSPYFSPLTGGIIFATTFVGGYMLGYLAEKSFRGSIMVGVVLHGAGNFMINLAQAFPEVSGELIISDLPRSILLGIVSMLVVHGA